MTTTTKLSSFFKLHWTWIFLIVFILITGFGARFFGGVGTSGDESHYLIITQSLLEDHDFDVKNNYENQTYKSFFADDIEPHVNWFVHSASDPHWYSVHGPGLSIIIIPFVALFGYKIGPIVFMILIEVIAILAGLKLATTIAEKKWLVFVGAIFAITVPIFSFAGHVFPDMVVGAIMPILCYLLYRNKHQPMGEIVIGLLCILMVWLHVRLGLVAGSILLIALWNIWKQKELRSKKILRTLLLFSPFVLGLALMQVLFYSWFHVLTPLGIWKGESRMFVLNPLKVMAALALDPAKGVMALSPVWFMAVIGFGQWFRRSRKLLFIVLAVTVPSIIIQSTFLDWGAGWCPPARYLVDFLPVFLPAIVLGFQEMIKFKLLRVIAIILAGLQGLIALLYIYLNTGLTGTGGPSPFLIAVRDKFHLSLVPVQYFSIHANPTVAGWTLIGFSIVFAVFLLVYWKKSTSQQKEK